MVGLLGVLQLLPVPVGTEAFGFVRDDPDRSVRVVGRELQGLPVHLDVRGPQLECPPHPGDEADHQNAKDEQGGNFQAVRALDGVDHGGVNEDQGNEAEADDLCFCFLRRADSVTAMDAEVIRTSTPVA